MEQVITNTAHPCYGLDCKDCETCIFDEDLYFEKSNMETCNNCGNLIRSYVGDERNKFNACCSRTILEACGVCRPRVIAFNSGPMLDIITPQWCAKKRGVEIEHITPQDIDNSSNPNLKLLPNKTEEKKESDKPLSVFEKKELLKTYPKHIEWDDIKEGCVYLIPKIFTQKRKVIKIVAKTDASIRYSEIEENGNEKKYLSTLYPTEVDCTFITEMKHF